MNAKVQTWETNDREVTRVEFRGTRRICRSLQIESTPRAQKVRVFMEPNVGENAPWQSLLIQLPDGALVEVRGSDFFHVDVRRPDGSFVGWLQTDPEPE